MKITRAAEYAVRCVYFLASKDIGLTVNKSEISLVMEIPEQFLSKIVQQLSHSGIVRIIQGPKGGLRLLRDPKEITLLEVVEVIMGKIFLNECVRHNSSHSVSVDYCKRKPGCSVHSVWMKAQQELRMTLRMATFKSLIESGTCFDRS